MISQIVNGLMLGSLYALITLGYALVLGSLEFSTWLMLRSSWGVLFSAGS